MDTLDFNAVKERLKDTGFNPDPITISVQIPNASGLLGYGLKHYVGEGAQWLPEYDEVADWLSDNKGRGILCYGNCGRGKTVICGKIIPVLLNYYHHKIVSCYEAQSLNAHADDVLSKHIVYIDDIGTESMAVKYGERRMVFSELCDLAEKKGKLIIVTTNLSLNEIAEKYGERTMDRLVAITKRVNFSGESLRR